MCVRIAKIKEDVKLIMLVNFFKLRTKKPMTPVGLPKKIGMHIMKKEGVLGRSRADHLFIRFKGLTVEKYNQIWESQGSMCLVCRSPDTSQLHVDHDHACCPSTPTCGNCIRGILCRKCNLGLGNFSDNIENLLRAVQYLSGELHD